MEIIRCYMENFEYVLEALNIVKYEGEIPPREVTRDDLQDFLLDSMNHVYIAKEDNRVVGYLVAYELHQIDRRERMMLLYELYVLSDYRRQGIATKMLIKLKDHLWGNGFYKMTTYTSCDNKTARKLYEKTGAQQCGQEDEIPFVWQFMM